MRQLPTLAVLLFCSKQHILTGKNFTRIIFLDYLLHLVSLFLANQIFFPSWENHSKNCIEGTNRSIQWETNLIAADYSC